MARNLKVPTLEEFKGLCLNEHCQCRHMIKKTRYKVEQSPSTDEDLEGVPMSIETYYVCPDCGMTSDIDPCLEWDTHNKTWFYRSGRILSHGRP